MTRTTTRIELISKIKRHPTASFFVFAFLISWTAWFLAPILVPRNTPSFGFISQIGSFGPTLSAIFVAALLNPEPSNASVKKRRVTFAAIFIASLVAQFVGTFAFGGYPSYQTVLFFALNSLIAAYVVSSIYHPKQGVTQLMAGLKRVSSWSVWVWIALLLPFVWQFIGAFVDLSFGGNEFFTLTPTVLVSLIAYYPFIFFFGGGLNEEPGWRGFAVRRMQRSYSPLIAGLIIGVIWSTWHFPLHATSAFGGGLEGFPLRFIYNVPLGVLFSWLYNRSGGNILACILLHASYNSASTIFGDNSALISIVLMIGFTVTVAVYDKMWRKNPKFKEQTINPTTTANTRRRITAVSTPVSVETT